MPDSLERRPGLAASDLHERMREAAFALLLTERRPIAAGELADLAGGPASRVGPMLEDLDAAGWIDRDEAGRVTGSAGLSLTTGPHRLQIDATTFRTWCAYDSIGIAAALAADASIETECAVCHRPISIRTLNGNPPGNRPERLWLAAGGTDLRADFCAPTVILCSSEHAAIWADRQGGHGRLVELTEAADLGADSWASCAVVVARVRGRSA